MFCFPEKPTEAALDRFRQMAPWADATTNSRFVLSYGDDKDRRVEEVIALTTDSATASSVYDEAVKRRPAAPTHGTEFAALGGA